MILSSPQRAGVAVLGSLLVFDAATFLLAAVLHLGVRLAIGPLVIALGQILPATVVEGLIGMLSLVTVYAIAGRVVWAWRFALGSNIFALIGVLVGLRAVSLGSSPDKALNVAYHEAMLAAIVLGLALLLTSGVRAALQRTADISPERMTRSDG